MTTISRKINLTWGLSITVVILALLTLFAFPYANQVITYAWSTPEYSHAILLPFALAYLLWHEHAFSRPININSSPWIGVFLIVLGYQLLFIADIGRFNFVNGYSLLLVIYGALLSAFGWTWFKRHVIALWLLFFAAPLPTFVLSGLSHQLQFVSTDLSTAFVRLLGISVFTDGNVIDLGTLKLEVVEACSGLRYLFPLISFSHITGILIRAPFWMILTLMVSSLPITVFINSFRIALIAIVHEYTGVSLAEGWLHDAEGFFIFGLALIALRIEIALINKITGSNYSFLHIRERAEISDASNGDIKRKEYITVSVAIIFMLVAGPVYYLTLSKPLPEVERLSFNEFPESINEWHGTREYIGQEFLDRLNLDDYILMNFNNGNNNINFYISYYKPGKHDDWRGHTPANCLPGGGWEITDQSSVELNIDDRHENPVPFQFNRLIAKESFGQKILVYYVFKERANYYLTNEGFDYTYKWNLVSDFLKSRRNDGALIRFHTALKDGLSMEIQEKRLQDFIKMILPLVPEYVPD